MSRPSDHIESRQPAQMNASINQPKLGFVGWMRWFWRQLTSMRVALFLLLLLAVAAVPGSLVPQRSSDPNGVTQYFVNNPDTAPFLDTLSAFDVYSSPWFSSIYLLLFISLIGCVIPRTKHHLQALRSRPPKTPVRLARLAGFSERTVAAPSAESEQLSDVERASEAASVAADVIDSARVNLRSQGYRVELFQRGSEHSVSAERGYLRETGNLIFHIALLGILVTVGFGSGFSFSGQRVIVEGQSFVNTLSAYDSFNPGRFFDDTTLQPYSVTLDKFSVDYEQNNLNAYGAALDYVADVTIGHRGEAPITDRVKVNEPLRTGGTDIFLLGNGYAPIIEVSDPNGTVVFRDSVPFLPQDANLTSIGIVKVPDGLAEQLGFRSFFYPTQAAAEPPYFSSYPDLEYPVLTLDVWSGDLGIDTGIPTSVYTLNTDDMTQLTRGESGTEAIELMPGATAELPNGLGSVTFVDAAPGAASGDFSESVPRFASFDIHHDPSQGWVLTFAILVFLSLMLALLIPRRRMWVKAIPQSDGSVRIEYAGLARGDDPALTAAVEALAEKHGDSVGALAVVNPVVPVDPVTPDAPTALPGESEESTLPTDTTPK